MTETSEGSKPKYAIVGINILIMLAYTIYFRLDTSNDLGIIGIAFFLGIHILLCLILAIFKFRSEFLLSAVLLLLVGFSTCVAVYSLF